jgi:hypothetical protein
VDTLEFSQSVELSHILDARSAIQYAGGVLGRAARYRGLTTFYLQAAYRHNLHEEILFFDRVLSCISRCEVRLRL